MLCQPIGNQPQHMHGLPWSDATSAVWACLAMQCSPGLLPWLYKRVWSLQMSMLRSYHPEHTGSHQNSEVKLDWAGLVLC
jgi:hypothetical protein